MGKQRRPEIKTGINRQRRVHWFVCPKCGPGPEHTAKIAARKDMNEHKCDG